MEVRLVGWAVGVMVLVTTLSEARADEYELEFTSATAPVPWGQQQEPTSKLVFAEGALTTEGVVSWRRELPLTAATGWAVEVALSAELAAGGAIQLFASDDRQAFTIQWDRGGIGAIDAGKRRALDATPHTIRLEVHRGRRRVLIDGKLLDDQEHTLTSMSQATPVVILSAFDPSHLRVPPQGGAPTTPMPRVVWTRFSIDTAPKRLARARKQIPALVEIPDGPFAETLRAIASERPALAPALAKLALPREAGLCVAATLLDVELQGVDRKLRAAQAELNEANRPRPICTPGRPGDCKRKEVPIELLNDREQHLRDLVPHIAALRALVDARGSDRGFGEAVRRAAQDPIGKARWGSLPARLKQLERAPTACR